MEHTSFYSENEEKQAPAEVVVAPGEVVTLSTFSAK
jgi:hypothetical protein